MCFQNSQTETATPSVHHYKATFDRTRVLRNILYTQKVCEKRLMEGGSYIYTNVVFFFIHLIKIDSFFFHPCHRNSPYLFMKTVFPPHFLYHLRSQPFVAIKTGFPPHFLYHLQSKPYMKPLICFNYFITGHPIL